jgi:hypothetical protein
MSNLTGKCFAVPAFQRLAIQQDIAASDGG